MFLPATPLPLPDVQLPSQRGHDLSLEELLRTGGDACTCMYKIIRFFPTCETLAVETVNQAMHVSVGVWSTV